MAPNRLNQLLAASGHPPLSTETSEKFAAYLTLLQKWNAKTNLTAIRDEEGILSRHFLESILCASLLGSIAGPPNIVTLLDFGSGAGFPGIPIALMRPEIRVTLAESQNKKAAFLREAIRILSLDSGELATKVHSARAEELATEFDCVTLRAVDNMAQAIPAAIQRLKPHGYLAILTTHEDAKNIQSTAANSSHRGSEFTWDSKPLQPNTTAFSCSENEVKLPLNPIYSPFNLT